MRLLRQKSRAQQPSRYLSQAFLFRAPYEAAADQQQRRSRNKPGTACNRINKSCNEESDDTKYQHAKCYFHGISRLGIFINKGLSLPNFGRINPFYTMV